VKGWRNIFHANGNEKKAGVATFISDKGNFKNCNKDNKGHYIMIKGQSSKKI